MAEAIRGSFRSVTGQELEKRLWPAEGQPKAVVQFVHGMAEHIDRYDAPAKALNQAGFIVVGHTHLGHGQNAVVKGYFAENDAPIWAMASRKTATGWPEKPDRSSVTNTAPKP